MKAVDTNVVVRLIVNDDPIQTAIAVDALHRPTLIGIAVLMEAAWVLRKTYRQPRATIAEAFGALLDIPTVHVPDEPGVRWAIERYRDHGTDLADMLHIVASKGASSFASFEKTLANKAGPQSPVLVETL